MLNLVVNGKPRELEESLDLVSFLVSYGVNLQHVAVGYNGTVLEKEKFSETVLKEGDVLEIVKPVGGG
ncbi:MAG: sulfur carrier protein ThiS [Dehalococcoidia bacterium]|nr:sulfur carrier protein ThiS [Dehalococcoidia bacterium]